MASAPFAFAASRDPVRYLTIVASLMPRELSLEHSIAADLDDGLLEQMIEHLRQQLLAQSGVEPQKLIEAKENGYARIE
jgi:hypothetical protein